MSSSSLSDDISTSILKNNITESTGTIWTITSSDSGGVLQIELAPGQKIVFESGHMIYHDALIFLGLHTENTIYQTVKNASRRWIAGEHIIEVYAKNCGTQSHLDEERRKRNNAEQSLDNDNGVRNPLLANTNNDVVQQLPQIQTILLAPSADGAITLFELKYGEKLHIQRGHYFARSTNCKTNLAHVVSKNVIKRFLGFMDVLHIVAEVQTAKVDEPKNNLAIVALNSAGRLFQKEIEAGIKYTFDNTNIVAWTDGLDYEPALAVGRKPNAKRQFLGTFRRGIKSLMSGEGVVLEFRLKSGITTPQYVLYSSRYEGITSLATRISNLESRVNRITIANGLAKIIQTAATGGGRSKRMQPRRFNSQALTLRSKHRNSQKNTEQTSLLSASNSDL